MADLLYQERLDRELKESARRLECYENYELTGEYRDYDGYDLDGYDKNGFDRDGYDRDGFDRTGHNRAGLSKEYLYR